MNPAKNTPHTWSEDKLQANFYQWFHNKFPGYRGLLWAVPNGGLRGGLEGKVLKATGLYPGVADMVFCWQTMVYFLELKRPDGKNDQSMKQKEWQATITEQGFTYLVFNDLKTLQAFILTIMAKYPIPRDKDNWPYLQTKMEL